MVISIPSNQLLHHQFKSIPLVRLLLHILIPSAIILIGVGGYFSLKKLVHINVFGMELGEEKKAVSTRKPRANKRPMFRTKAMPLEAQDYTIKLSSQGEVRAHNATTLTAQVNGRISNISTKFEDGAFFSKGDILLEIDPADYNTELTSSQAQLARAKANFAQEKARAKQALLNWKDAGFKEEPSDLVLRKPQLHEAEATVTSATSSVQRAVRNLERTKVRAPYDGRVSKRRVGLGQQVGGSTPLGDIFSTDFAEVRLPLTTRDLQYYTPPQRPGEHGKKNNITFSSILTGNDKHWQGTILRAEGELDEKSRQLFVIARIDDPFALKSKSYPIYIGQPMRATIPAVMLKKVFIIPRAYMSGLNEVLLVRDGTFKRLSIDPIWSGNDTVVTRGGIQEGDHLSIDRLPYAPDGAPVEILADDKLENRTTNGASKRIGKKRIRPAK